MAETMGERLAGVWARTDRIFEMLAPEAFLASPINWFQAHHPYVFATFRCVEAPDADRG